MYWHNWCAFFITWLTFFLPFFLFVLQPNGFNIEITNTNPSVVMVGVRILIGCQSLEKAPSFVEIFGRVIQLSLSRNRWFDLPFSREESLSADKKFSLFSMLPFLFGWFSVFLAGSMTMTTLLVSTQSVGSSFTVSNATAQPSLYYIVLFSAIWDF